MRTVERPMIFFTLCQQRVSKMELIVFGTLQLKERGWVGCWCGSGFKSGKIATEPNAFIWPLDDVNLATRDTVQI